MSILALDNLHKQYGALSVTQDFSLEVELGEIVGILGPNGAGKTTLFRLFLDLIRAERGFITSNEKNVAITEDWKTYTSAYLDEGFLIPHLTPEEYFYFCGKLHNLSTVEVDERLKTFDSFFEGAVLKSKKYIRDLSKGNQFKVGIAACLLQQPQILVLDEPFANLDPTSQIRLIQMLKKLHEEKRMTILISSHDLNHITDVCTRILLMEKGKIIKDIKTESNTLIELEEYFKV
jgi:ABC-2 type transport system ATP-binding protein